MKRAANLFVLVDGLGWEWIKSTPFLGDAAPYRRPLKTVLGFSAGAIPSILTGRYPGEHGRLAMFHRASGADSSFRRFRWLCLMPPRLVENRYVRHAVQLMAVKLAGIEGYFNIYDVPLRYLPMLDVNEKLDIYRPRGIPGSDSIFDVLAANGAAYRSYCYRQGSDAQILDRAEADLAAGEAAFYFLYLAEIDAFLHAHADDPTRAAARLTEYSARLTRLREAALRRFGEVRLHVFSDHGMAPTRGKVNLQVVLDTIVPKPLSDYLCLLDSTMARFWFHSPHARAQVMNALPDSNAGRWLREPELKSLRAWFPDQRFGEEIYLMSEGYVIEPSHMSRVAPKGMHGFHPDAPHSHAMILSSHDYSSSLQHITDIFGVMKLYC